MPRARCPVNYNFNGRRARPRVLAVCTAYNIIVIYRGHVPKKMCITREKC